MSDQQNNSNSNSAAEQQAPLFSVLGESEVDAVKGPRLDSPPPGEATSPTDEPKGPALLPGAAEVTSTGTSQNPSENTSPVRHGSAPPAAAPQTQGGRFGRSRSSAVRFTNKAAADNSILLQKPNRAPIAEESRSKANGIAATVVAIQGWRKTMEDHHCSLLRDEERLSENVVALMIKSRQLQSALGGGGSGNSAAIPGFGTMSESQSISMSAGGSVTPPTSALTPPGSGLEPHKLRLELPFEAFLGIYDGHQNANTSAFLKSRLHEVLFEHLAPLAPLLGSGPYSGTQSPNSTITDQTDTTATVTTSAGEGNSSFGGKHQVDAGAQAAIQHAFNTAFAKVDEEHRAQLDIVHGGSTVGIVVVTTHYIILANLGDCRAAVLCSSGNAISLEKEHRLGVNEEEKQRVTATGTSTDKDRVGGVLSVSRAMGDFAFKPVDKPIEMRPVSVVPEVMVIPRSEDQEYVIVGCDGVWELQSVSSIQEQLLQSAAAANGGEDAEFGCETVYKIVNKCSSSNVALHDKAGVQLGCDNVSLGVLKLK